MVVLVSTVSPQGYPFWAPSGCTDVALGLMAPRVPPHFGPLLCADSGPGGARLRRLGAVAVGSRLSCRARTPRDMLCRCDGMLHCTAKPRRGVKKLGGFVV